MERKYFFRFMSNKLYMVPIMIFYFFMAYFNLINNREFYGDYSNLSTFAGYGFGYYLPIQWAMFFISMSSHLFPVTRLLELESSGAFKSFLPRYKSKFRYILNIIFDSSLVAIYYCLSYCLISYVLGYLMDGNINIYLFIKMAILRMLEMLMINILYLFIFSILGLVTPSFIFLIFLYLIPCFTNYNVIFGVSSLERYISIGGEIALEHYIRLVILILILAFSYLKIYQKKIS